MSVGCSCFKQLARMSTAASNEFVALSNGVLIPKIGLGTWQLTDPVQCTSAVQKCLEANYKLIDTAPVYRNEDIIGDTVDIDRHELGKFGGYKKSGLETANGKGVFITSKVGPHQMRNWDKAQLICESTDEDVATVPLRYLLHWPGAVKVPPTSNVHRKIRHESWKALETLYKEKKVRAIGVCNFLSHHLKSLIEDGIEIVPMVDQLEIHPLCPNWELRETAKQLGVAVQAYSSLGSGSKTLLQHPVVLEVAEMEGRSVAQVLLRWALQQDILIIPRSTSSHHLADNISLLGWTLSQDSMDRLNQICPSSHGSAGEVHFCWNPITIP